MSMEEVARPVELRIRRPALRPRAARTGKPVWRLRLLGSMGTRTSRGPEPTTLRASISWKRSKKSSTAGGWAHYAHPLCPPGAACPFASPIAPIPTIDLLLDAPTHTVRCLKPRQESSRYESEELGAVAPIRR